MYIYVYLYLYIKILSYCSPQKSRWEEAQTLVFTHKKLRKVGVYYMVFKVWSVTWVCLSVSYSQKHFLCCKKRWEQEGMTDPQKQVTYSCIIVVQLPSRVWLFATPWTAAHEAPLSITNFWSLLKFMSIELVMPSNHLILCRPLLLLPSIFPSIQVFSMSWLFISGGQSVGSSAPIQYQSFQWIFRIDFL